MRRLVDSALPHLQPQKVMQWFRDLLRGLVLLESNHVVHRDLKLNNLLLDENGRLVISDFGKAAILDETMKIPFRHGACVCVKRSGRV